MINKISYYVSNNLIPYENLGVEEYLLNRVEENECILYLWQNENTVVIGKNQNAKAEVRISALEEDGGYLVRRLSGGGAVYHDKGNLNFTFLVRKKNYDLEKQCRVILEMARSFGLDARQTGRNDILIEDGKFSGNAYYNSGDHSYHHGTIMVNVDINQLGKFLNVSMDKLESKGVASVKSRVVNLSNFDVDITIEKVKNAMIKAFEKVYDLPAEIIDSKDLDWNQIRRNEARFASPEWKYGRDFPFSFSKKNRYTWGGLEVFLDIKAGKIVGCEIYSDAMDSSLIEEMKEALIGREFNNKSVSEALNMLGNREEINDVIELLRI